MSPGFPLSGPLRPMTVSRARCLADFSTEPPSLIPSPPTFSPFRPKVGPNPNLSAFYDFRPSPLPPLQKKGDFAGFSTFRAFSADGTIALAVKRPISVPNAPISSLLLPRQAHFGRNLVQTLIFRIF